MGQNAKASERLNAGGAVAPHPLSSVDAAAFRNALSRLAAAVNVITTDGPAGQCGVTASAVCSVSDTPPTVLVCLNRAHRMNGFVKANGTFCINMLAADQQDIAEMFAGFGRVGMAERFIRCGAISDMDRAPIVANAIAAIDCDITGIREVGTHSVIFGTARAIKIGKDQRKAPLVYHQRHYHTVQILKSNGESA
ncbi:FMN reductase (NADH) RutF [Maritalea myrionectae]|uniref:FMN reductase (NADH) RutF n=1 Tax=Maritalea myrionectae TaxID=454601 RepID=A0A2R4MI78_9HYPH|nr:flavin reductase [Maritalea myrionectae]AVX05737.1 FMN reductase (NADH) RutF [Maritalea myrionectae]